MKPSKICTTCKQALKKKFKEMKLTRKIKAGSSEYVYLNEWGEGFNAGIDECLAAIENL